MISELAWISIHVGTTKTLAFNGAACMSDPSTTTGDLVLGIIHGRVSPQKWNLAATSLFNYTVRRMQSDASNHTISNIAHQELVPLPTNYGDANVATGQPAHKEQNRPRLDQDAHRRWMASEALDFLKRVNCIKIRDTHSGEGGGVFYVVEVCQDQPGLAATQVDATIPSVSAGFVVRRSFYDFQELRQDVFGAVSTLPQCTCQYCLEFIMYLRYKLNQPRTIVKIATGPEKRKKILTQFINDTIAMGKRRVQKTGKRRCQAQTLVPILLKHFLGGQKL